MSQICTRLRLACRLVRARVRRRPHTLSHLVTARCNGRCATCLWNDPARPELDTAALTWLYQQAGRAGMAQVVVWGGEPLLRDDLPQLLHAAQQAGLVTTLVTNGWLLEERWPGLRGLVDALILSLDDEGAAHDGLRELPGLFSRLESAVAMVNRDPSRPLLLVNTVLSRLNRGALARVAPVAQRWGAGLYFCPMETGTMTSAGFVPRHADLTLPNEELSAAARQAEALQRAGYPIMNTRAYLDLLARDPQLREYTCRVPYALLTVEADGAVRDCRRTDQPLASVGELRAAGRSLESVFSLPRYRELGREAAGCTVCNNPDVVEMSWLWDLRPTMLQKGAKLASLSQ